MSKGEDTRQFIIEKAAFLYNRKGIAGTSISDIMEATGLAKGGVYRRFESKEEITMEVFDFLAKRLFDSINAAIKDKRTATDKLIALLDHYYDRLVMAKQGGCPLLNFGVEADDTDPLLRDRVGKGIKVIQDQIGRIVADGIGTGEYRSSVDAGKFGIKMFNLLEGTILACRVLRSKGQMKLLAEMLKIEIQGFKNN
ncbi:MAG TPA: TetR/AcrR family transcriptional regulator [Puia sp.]|jgi:AcrR family transcriptional regulator|nr:TetR/AcrR family transcriptional regulator [Puia sp.]